ncbi:outer membrane beta-barrel protein [Flagellimonas flava]|uniref:Uncharacterized protein n=1 Tax=Flagellimonas flava TaxID=570519 RepID=A0A1M5Q2D6_9FLAO|nr:outer membrane beta-barrel protein [Allomuricauda flava]SHH08066.1 hypothetical protein SAMN04488116_3479 [Allomuricauda flava]
MGKKNLEQLFREKLGDFHEVPDEKVWKSIEASLDKKKRKRVVPIWWQLGGVAAVLAILLYVFGPFGNEVVDEQIQVTETENKRTTEPENNTADELLNSADVSGDEGLANTEESADSSKEENAVAETSEDAIDNLQKNQSRTNTQLAVSDSEKKKNTSDQKQLAPLESNKDVRTTEVVDAGMEKAGENSINENSEAVASDITQHQFDTEKKDLFKTTTEEKETVAENKNLDQSLENKDPSFMLKEKNEEKEVVALQEEETEKEDDRPSIYDVIAKQEEEAVAQNSTGNKWSIGPSVAPVYFSASGEGSPVHSNFAANSKSGNVDLSYGLTVAYEIGKKLKVRSGVHRVNFGYDTNDVVFSSSLNGSADQIDNIDYSRTSRNVVVESKDNSSLNSDSPEFAAAESAVLDGKMVQQLGYVEVPVELNYSLIDKKFGVNLIGGVSSLFLVDNSVLLESEGLVTEMGEANNVNSLNFSTNIGVGLNYEFSPKVQLNLEPVFKYQLNTFSDTAGSFRPFSVGVYSGVSFKF